MTAQFKTQIAHEGVSHNNSHGGYGPKLEHAVGAAALGPFLRLICHA